MSGFADNSGIRRIRAKKDQGAARQQKCLVTVHGARPITDVKRELLRLSAGQNGDAQMGYMTFDEKPDGIFDSLHLKIIG